MRRSSNSSAPFPLRSRSGAVRRCCDARRSTDRTHREQSRALAARKCRSRTRWSARTCAGRRSRCVAQLKTVTLIFARKSLIMLERGLIFLKRGPTFIAIFSVAVCDPVSVVSRIGTPCFSASRSPARAVMSGLSRTSASDGLLRQYVIAPHVRLKSAQCHLIGLSARHDDEAALR